jgi:hypothetical protein
MLLSDTLPNITLYEKVPSIQRFCNSAAIKLYRISLFSAFTYRKHPVIKLLFIGPKLQFFI